MHVLVTGASGRIGSAVTSELISAGHTVTGLVRSERSAAAVRALGAQVRQGDLADLEGLNAAVRDADGVIHLAFKNQEMRSGDLAGAVAADLLAIDAIGTALKGSGKPFVGTNATLGMVLAGFSGQLTESDTLPGGPRIDAENRLIALAEQGVRSSVVRLPPTVHGLGGYGFVNSLIATARRTGVAGYVGDGSNRWPSADTRDVAVLYRLALESAPAGSRLHAVAEEGVTLLDTAQAVGRQLGIPATPIDAENVGRHFGFLSPFIGLDNPTSSAPTRDMLGWKPTRPGLLADLSQDPAFAAGSTDTRG
jgi:nucleoside-diphosphate-sugar epimerase